MEGTQKGGKYGNPGDPALNAELGFHKRYSASQGPTGYYEPIILTADYGAPCKVTEVLLKKRADYDNNAD